MLLPILTLMRKSRDSSVGIATGYGLDGLGLIPGRTRDFSPFYSVNTGFGAYPASYPVCTGGKSGLHLVLRSGMVDIYLHFSHMSSWLDA
jgi:hypothetical protein